MCACVKTDFQIQPAIFSDVRYGLTYEHELPPALNICTISSMVGVESVKVSRGESGGGDETMPSCSRSTDDCLDTTLTRLDTCRGWTAAFFWWGVCASSSSSNDDSLGMKERGLVLDVELWGMCSLDLAASSPIMEGFFERIFWKRFHPVTATFPLYTYIIMYL